MTVKTASKTATVAAPFAFKGRNAVIRNTALQGVAAFAYAEGQSRADTVARLKLALGSKPTADEVKAVALQYVIGRTAQKISSDPSNNGKSVAELIAFAAQLVTSYASPLKDGVKAKKLRAGQVGRRTVAQHKAIRASEEAWSQLKAEVVPELSNAKTQSERNASKRGASNKLPTGKTDAESKAGKGITHSELVKSDGPMTRDAACDYIVAMASTLQAFCNKHAKVVPAGFGSAVKAFKVQADKEAALLKSVTN